MKLTHGTLPILLIAITSGCASTPKYAITYNTEPPGASLICNGVNNGYTPRTLSYELNKDNERSGIIQTAPCRAQWSSGASGDYSRFFSITEYPQGVMQTLQRPNEPGYEQDAEFALKVQQLQYQRQQAEAAEKAANQQQFINNRTTTCYTNYGITRCY